MRSSALPAILYLTLSVAAGCAGPDRTASTDGPLDVTVTCASSGSHDTRACQARADSACAGRSRLTDLVSMVAMSERPSTGLHVVTAHYACKDS